MVDGVVVEERFVDLRITNVEWHGSSDTLQRQKHEKRRREEEGGREERERERERKHTVSKSTSAAVGIESLA